MTPPPSLPVLPLLSAGAPALCATATANDRVVDIVEQLGAGRSVVVATSALGSE